MKESVNSCRNEAPTLPSLKTITRGVQIFILFSIVGTLLAFWWKKPMGFEVFLQKLKWSYMLILIPLVWVDYLLGGLRYKLFFEGKYL
ncbi:MAG: hypothetical protein OEW23_09640, partial [Candidatus Aminicenantes bacterium]|nr:hypothetical protein [Candidatus Aminicenantes bacterium]